MRKGHSQSKSDLECITETFCFPPGRAPGTNGFVKGVTELHCGNCRSLTLLKQRRSKIPRWAFLKCCTASNQTCAYHFLHLCTFFFFSIFVFPSPELAVMATLCVSDRGRWCRGWWWLSWQREAGAEEDVGRVRRWWEAGQLSTRWSRFRNRRRRPLTFSNLHSLTSFTTTPKIRPLCRNIRMRFTKWKENIGNTVTASGVKNRRIYKVWMF